MEAYSKARTADAITALASLRPKQALLVTPNKFSIPNNFNKTDRDLEKAGVEFEAASLSSLPGSSIEKVSLDLLEVGDVVRVLQGSSPPADGNLLPGESSAFDESSLTGESKPIQKFAGDKVFLGTINKGATVHIKIDEIGGGTMYGIHFRFVPLLLISYWRLDNIVKIVREGQTRRAPMERIADIVTGYFVPSVTLLALLTWIIWLTLGLTGSLPEGYLDTQIGGWRKFTIPTKLWISINCIISSLALWSLEFAIAVFVVACPCGIGLAAPTALLVGSGLAAKFGLLARGGGEAFQEMSEVDVIVFDKTGTLTEGSDPRVTDVYFMTDSPWDKKIVLGIAKELEGASSHPLAAAIEHYCAANEFNAPTSSAFEETAGMGLQGKFTEPSCTAIIGNEALMQKHEVQTYSDLSVSVERWKREGKSVVLLAICNDVDSSVSDFSGFRVAVAFAVSDVIRPEASTVVAWLQKRGISTWMISGDNLVTASAVASSVGIPATNVIAGVLPHQKVCYLCIIFLLFRN